MALRHSSHRALCNNTQLCFGEDACCTSQRVGDDDNRPRTPVRARWVYGARGARTSTRTSSTSCRSKMRPENTVETPLSPPSRRSTFPFGPSWRKSIQSTFSSSKRYLPCCAGRAPGRRPRPRTLLLTPARAARCRAPVRKRTRRRSISHDHMRGHPPPRAPLRNAARARAMRLARMVQTPRAGGLAGGLAGGRAPPARATCARHLGAPCASVLSLANTAMF